MFISLQDKRPDLVNEWDYDKNCCLPNEIRFASSYNVHWKCKYGHEWITSPHARVSHGNNCPYCNRGVTDVYNLAVTYPDLLKEWNYKLNDGINPYWLTPQSHKVVSWVCTKGHTWSASIINRTKNHSGCPYCNSGKRISFHEKAIVFYLHKFFPSLRFIENYTPSFLNGKEFDIFIPELQLAIECDGAYHINKMDKDILKNNLSLENNIRLIRIRDSVLPELHSSSIDYIATFLDNENFNLTLIKMFNIEFNKSIDVDIERDSNSIYDLLERKLVANSIIDNEKVMRYWDYTKNTVDPKFYSRGSESKVYFLCPTCGFSFKKRICDAVRNKEICIRCNGYYRDETNSIIATNPELLEEWDYVRNNIKPSEVSGGCERNVWWHCKFGHYYSARISSRARYNKTGCHYCHSGKEWSILGLLGTKVCPLDLTQPIESFELTQVDGLFCSIKDLEDNVEEVLSLFDVYSYLKDNNAILYYRDDISFSDDYYTILQEFDKIKRRC